jgi:hypothetical protein
MKKYLFVVIFFAISCSSIKPIHRPIKDNGHNGIELDFEEKKDNKNKDLNQVEIKKNEETIKIGENGGQVFSENLNIEENKIEKSLKIGIILGPGLYRTITYISILKNLEKNNLAPKIITGSEMGAVIAGLYASGVTPEMIEWLFFKYFKEHKNYKPYEKEWINEIDEFFLMKIKNNKIEDSRIKLYLTLFDHNSKKAFFFDKGNIRDLVLLNLRRMDNPLKFKTGESYSGAFEKEIFNNKLMSRQGSEFNISVNALNGNSKWENATNSDLTYLILKLVKTAKAEEKNFDMILNLPLQKMMFDGTRDANAYVQTTNDFINKQIPLIKKKINLKLDNLNSLEENQGIQ